MLDYAAITLAGLSSLALRNLCLGNRSIYSPDSELIYILIPAIFLLLMFIKDLYAAGMQFWATIQNIVKACCWSVLAIVFFQFAAHTSGQTSRVFILLLLLFSIFYLICLRYIVKVTFKACGLFQRSVLVVGGGEKLLHFLQKVNSDVCMSYKLTGLISEEHKAESIAPLLGDAPLLGGYDKLEEAIRSTGASSIVIVLDNPDPETITSLVCRAQPLVKTVGVIPDYHGIPLGNVTCESMYDEKLLLLRLRNNLAIKSNRLLKYTFDFLMTFFGAIAISPLFMIIALWIYIDSPGPILFKHKRVGKGGKPFYCYKFRSMCVNAQEKLQALLKSDPQAKAEWEKDFKLKHDPRITKSGAFLRKTSLDELPQIFNVLKGEMSLVGPRPIVTGEIERYREHISDYYMVRPGITGLWQTSGRNDVDYTERVELDSWYVRNWSIWIDTVILFRTFKVAIKGRGAY